MFDNKGSNFLFKENGRSSARGETAYSKKNEQLHKQIRRQQIEERLRRMREDLLASFSQDYHYLKGINLNQTIRSFQQLNENQIENSWENLDKLASNIFIYSKSDQSSHMNQLFDDQIITKMTNLLQISNIQSFQHNPRTYIRILWVVQNYTNYVADSEFFKKEIPSSMVSCKIIAQALFAEVFNIPFFYSEQAKYKIFSHSQAKQILGIVLSTVVNLSKNNDLLLELCFKPSQGLGQSFIAFLINECYKIIDFTNKVAMTDTLVPNILSNMLGIFEKVLRLEIDQKKTMQKVYELDLKTVEVILELLSLISRQDKERTIQYQACYVIKSFLQTHLQTKPQIIITHNFTLLFDMYKSITQGLISTNYDIFNYDKMLDVEGINQKPLYVFKKKAAQLEQRCILLLQVFNVMFSLNIPQDNCERYDQVYGCWVDDYLLPIFHKIFKINDPNLDKIRYEILLILGNLCLQQQYCDLILGELPILNKVFYYIHSRQVQTKMKKAALNVINSIIRVAIQQESDLRMEVIDLLKNNRIVDILAEFIGESSQKKVNIDLLHSLLMFLRTEVTEDRCDHQIWAQFCSQGGQAQLQKYHSSTKDAEVQSTIELILDEYRCQ